MKFLLSVILLAGVAFAQSDAHNHAAQPPAPKTEAQLSFDNLKTLAGEWEGPVSIEPAYNGVKMADVRVVMRVTSRGNAIVHELQENTGAFWMRPAEVSAKVDHPVTMLYLDNGQLNLVHYCDAGNRPHMLAKPSTDGKTVAFEFVDISGDPKRGHMHGGTFTVVDANHHVEDWFFMLPGDKLMHAHMDLHRVN